MERKDTIEKNMCIPNFVFGHYTRYKYLANPRVNPSNYRIYLSIYLALAVVTRVVFVGKVSTTAVVAFLFLTVDDRSCLS